jgi:hypothetical protein
MSWTTLLASKTVVPLPTTKAELDKLRSLDARSLNDVAAPGLSTDMRFILAYDAARSLALMVVRAAGYRPKKVGGHYNTFLALEAADPAFAALSTYFDGCRIKRNASEYDFAGGVTDMDADGLLNAVKQFAQDSEAWISKPIIQHWPELSGRHP